MSPPGPPPASGWGVAPEQPSTGCLKVSLALVLGIAVLLVLAVLAIWAAFGGLLGQIGTGAGMEDGSLDAACPFLSDDEARDVLGGQADAILLSGLYQASIGLIVDTRALADSEDCWVNEGARAYIARIALHQGGDATAVFAAERQKAMPSSSSQGGGVSVENPGYFGDDVIGLGDEAFCTGISPATMAGVLVRDGDRVVYATVGPPENETPELFTTDAGVVTSPGLCAVAQELARAVLD